MLRREHIVFLSNTRADSLYGDDNDCYLFTTHLEEPLILEPLGAWSCSLIHCVTQRAAAPLYVTCDVIEESLLQGRKFPVLRMIHDFKGTYPDYSSCHPVIAREIRNIQILLVNAKTGEEQLPNKTLETKRTYCTLQFFRNA